MLRRRKWLPTLVFLPGKSHGQRNLVGCSPWGHKELDMTEWLTISGTPSDTKWMLWGTWIIAKIPANSQNCSVLDFSGEIDTLYLLSSNPQAALCILGLPPIIDQEGGIFVSPEVPTPVHGYFPLFPFRGLFPFLCLSFNCCHFGLLFLF